MTMSEQSQQTDLGQLTLFAVDGHASQSLKDGSAVQQESKLEQTISDGSGQKWLGLSKNSGPLGLLEKMLLVLSKWDYSIASSMTWSVRATPQGRLIFKLGVSVKDTDDNGVLLWPTPRASDSEGGIVKDTQFHNGRFDRVNKQGVTFGVKLRDAVACLDEGKHLNPQFSEQLMGFPVDWTKLDTPPWETVSASRSLPKSEGLS